MQTPSLTAPGLLGAFGFLCASFLSTDRTVEQGQRLLSPSAPSPILPTPMARLSPPPVFLVCVDGGCPLLDMGGHRIEPVDGGPTG